MFDKKEYANGQKTYELKGDQLIYFFRNGKVKAEGFFINELMEGEWKFYRATGQLWQVGNFKNGKKSGSWIRYDKNGKPESEDIFLDNEKIRKKK